ncbi:MAG: response regulator transcription factor [Chitinophagaceae bacterium]|nr:MAG: response regulator transcription factor [Chitinophagaceae bacterium]
MDLLKTMIDDSPIEDEQEFRESLALLINGNEGFVCTHTFSNANDAIRHIPGLMLDVVLVDIHLGGKSGIEVIAAVKPVCPQTQFLMCTSFEDSNSVFLALKSGASGYMSKGSLTFKLLDAIKEVHEGGSPMSSQIARLVVMSFQNREAKAELSKLSVREKEILDLLCKGYRYKEISDQLFISTETVRKHIRNIYEKLQVNSRTDAINKVYGNSL